MKKLILLIVLIYFCNGISVSAQPLQGEIGIDVKQEMEPLDPLLWKGNSFDKKVATPLIKDESVSSRIWKKIPAWQAGEWEHTQAINTKAIQYIHGQSHTDIPVGVYINKGEITLGWQKDKNGDIWQQYDSGYWTQTEFDSCIGHSFMKVTAPGADKYPDLYSESIEFSVDKSTNKITSVDQRKRWERFVYLSPGLCREEAVQTWYDENGKPLGSSWNIILLKRTRTFAENEIQCSAAFRQRQKDFFNYLKNNGLSGLIPTGADAGNKETATRIKTMPTY